MNKLFLSLLFGLPTQAKSIDLKAQLDKLAPVEMTANTSTLSNGDKEALQKIISASKLMDGIFLRQVWNGNVALRKKLEADKSEKGKLLGHLFKENVGPWLRLDKNLAFIEGVPKQKPLTAGFYPDGLTREEFEAWAHSLSPAVREQAVGFFTVIVRDPKGKLTSVPYSKVYQEFLIPAAKLLYEAADLTTNASLKKFLKLRADSFGSDNYSASDVAWMDMDAPLDITIGPYETYEDELFGYKAAFEAFVCVKNDKETAKLEKFSGSLQELENHLPFDPKFRNPKLGASSPIRVVDEVFTSGDARRGVMTAAFNLPNDEKVVKEKGSKRVMLKNVQEAKFEQVLVPIAGVVLKKEDQKNVLFSPFFTHILMHELAHGLGPHNRMALKELYSPIEEAKADITGLWAMHYLMDKKEIDPALKDAMYATFLASSFRSVRFGLNEAHGKAVALQFNYLTDQGGFAFDAATGTFHVVPDKIRDAVTKLAGELLTVEAKGDYSRAKSLLQKYATIRPAMQKALSRLSSIPVDVEPSYPLAGEVLGDYQL